jgi:ubiquinone/menaquinone biosynthesis C-methylase UbiE
VQWLGAGRTVLEAGPGRGDLAVKTLTETSTIREYILADISLHVLDYAGKRLDAVKKETLVTRIHADLNEKNALQAIPPGSVDRIILVNVFEYLDPITALEQFSTVLGPGGLLRFNVGDVEFHRSGTGTPGFSRQLVMKQKRPEGSRAQPAGFTVTPKGEEIPVFRFRHGYTRGEITAILENHGFKDIEIRRIEIPLASWLRLRPRISVSQKYQAVAEKWEISPIWDIIARKKE